MKDSNYTLHRHLIYGFQLYFTRAPYLWIPIILYIGTLFMDSNYIHEMPYVRVRLSRFGGMCGMGWMGRGGCARGLPRRCPRHSKYKLNISFET